MELERPVSFDLENYIPAMKVQSNFLWY